MHRIKELSLSSYSMYGKVLGVNTQLPYSLLANSK